MEFDSTNTKEEMPLALLKIKNIELENNLLLEKQKYILLQSELESVKLIASKQLDVYKSECMRLKEIIFMLENDFNSFRKKIKNQEAVKNACKKIKKVGEIASYKHGKLEKNGTEREKNCSNESESRNRSVIVSDDLVQLTSKPDSGFIELKNDSGFQMGKNIPSESLPFCKVESLSGKEISVELADINNISINPRKKFKSLDCVCYVTLEASCEDGKRKKIESTQSSKDKSEAYEDGLDDDKENESDDDEENNQSKSGNENKPEKKEQEKVGDGYEGLNLKKDRQIIDITSDEMKAPKKVKKTTSVSSPTCKTKANGRNGSGKVFVRKKKIADPTTKNSMLTLKTKENPSSKSEPKASKPEPKEKPASKSESKGTSASKIESNDVVNGDGEKVIDKMKNADSPKSTLTSEMKEKSTSKLELKEKLTSKSEPKVKSASKPILKRPSTLKLESKDESVSKPESKEKPSVKRSSGGSREPEMLGKSNPCKEELRITICDILKKVDFGTTTVTDIFEQVDACYETDLSPWKAYIRLMIQEELIKLADKLEDEEKSSEEEIAHETKVKKAKF